jgi:hypothetical protein
VEKAYLLAKSLMTDMLRGTLRPVGIPRGYEAAHLRDFVMKPIGAVEGSGDEFNSALRGMA